MHQITANARKHTWYFYQVVRKTLLQSVQEIKISPPFRAIWLLHQITANARKHTWYFYQVVRKTSLQSVQEIKISPPFRAIWLLHQITANARKHTWYFYQVVRKTSLQSVQELKFRHLFSNLALASSKCSQTHLVFLPSSSKDLTAKCARIKISPPFQAIWLLHQITECSQTHLVFSPRSSKDLTAKCARNKNFAAFLDKFALVTNHCESL